MQVLCLNVSEHAMCGGIVPDLLTHEESQAKTVKDSYSILDIPYSGEFLRGSSFHSFHG